VGALACDADPAHHPRGNSATEATNQEDQSVQIDLAVPPGRAEHA
jgi:hypothetical protein